MSWLIEIVVLILRALVPALVEDALKRNVPTSEDAAPAVNLRDRLRAKVRETWGLSRTNVRGTS